MVQFLPSRHPVWVCPEQHFSFSPASLDYTLGFLDIGDHLFLLPLSYHCASHCSVVALLRGSGYQYSTLSQSNTLDYRGALNWTKVRLSPLINATPVSISKKNQEQGIFISILTGLQDLAVPPHSSARVGCWSAVKQG